jgi:hypothetical protein
MTIETLETGELEAGNQYKPLSDEKVKELARDLYADKIFGSWMIPENQMDMMIMVFMVLIFMDDITKKQMKRDNTFFFYEYYDKAGPRSINGYPTFMSCHILSGDDVKRIINKRNEIAALIEGV